MEKATSLKASIVTPITTTITNLYHNHTKTFIVSTLVIISGAGYLFFIQGEDVADSVYSVKQVTRSTIVENVAGEGQIVANNQITLKPVVSGNLSSVYVQNGQFIKKGTKIASIYSYDAIKAVRDAKLSLDQAKLSLSKLKQGPDNLQSVQIENAIAQAEESKKSQELTLTNARKTYLNSNLAVTPKYSFATTIPTLGGSYTCESEGTYTVRVFGDQFQYYGLEIGSGYVGNSGVPQALGVCGLTLTFESGKDYANGDWNITIPNTLSTSYTSNQNQYNQTKQSVATAIASAERTIAEQKAKLASLVSPNALDIESAELTVQQRENALQDAYNNLSNYTITAPFDGVVSGLSVSNGDFVNQSTALGILSSNKLMAEITFNEVDIAKVALGQKATLTLDAIDNIELNGEIVDIDSVGEVTQGVVSYGVKLSLSGEKVSLLKVGMSVSANILTNTKEGVLVIPLSAVKSRNKIKYVEVIDAGNVPKNITAGTSSETMGGRSASSTARTGANRVAKTQGTTSPQQLVGVYTVSSGGVEKRQVNIEVGMQNDTEVEVISGLSPGDYVIVKTTTSTATTQTNSAPSLLNSIGGRTTSSPRP
ncbi:MAG: HlyD family secretion protein [Patescibacteria group bacterium]|nr:HlyD family secretion protein [Patescibacteria group bacterium]